MIFLRNLKNRWSKIKTKIITEQPSIKNITLHVLLLKRHVPYISLRYYFAIVLPKLVSCQSMRKALCFRITSSGVLIIFYEKKVIKIGLSSNTYHELKKNLSVFNTLKKNNSLCHLVNYQQSMKDNIFISSRLNPCNLTPKFATNAILSNFTQNKLSQQNSKPLIYFCSIANEHYKIINKLKQNIPRQISILLSPMHGDLTPDNIMKNHMGKPVLIDLDRFTLSGPAFYDRMHYQVEYRCKQEKINFFEHLNEEILNCSCEKKFFLLLSYFVVRLSLEYRKGINKNKYYLKKVNDLTIIFIEKSIKYAHINSSILVS